MNKLTKYWKIYVALICLVVGVSVAVKYASAESVKVIITGDELSDGSWKVGDTPVVWSASAFDSSISDTALTLDANTTITWSSSDTGIVNVIPRSSGSTTVSEALLTPVSAGTANVTATFKSRVDNGDGTFSDVTATATKKIVVKFEVKNAPAEPYEDSSVVPDIITTATGSVTYRSSNEEVAQITANPDGTGKVTLVGAGASTVTATLSDGQKATFRIVVNARITETENPITVQYNTSHKLQTNAVRNENIFFESGNQEVADVDEDGTVHGFYAGKTTVYVRALTASDPWYNLLPNPARGISVEVPFTITSTPTLNVGDTAVLKTNVADKYSSQVSWNTSDSSVVEITQDGCIKGIKNGTAKIYATINNKDLFGTSTAQYTEINVTVIDSFSLSDAEKTIQIGETGEISALVTDNNATVDWSISDQTVAEITTSNAEPFKITVTGKKKGTAVVTAVQTVNGVTKTATCVINVTEPVQKITLLQKNIKVDKGSTYQLTAVFTPELPDNRNITWVSSDESVAVVSDTGLVTGVAGGNAVVSVVTEDGIKVASCDVYVRVPVTGITISETKISESLNLKTHQLTATVSPSGAGVDTTVEWSVSPSNGSVITVDSTGLVTYVAPGNATVIAKSVDGGYIASCQVEVLKPVSSVTLDFTELELNVSDTFRISAEVLPENASDKSVTWESSDITVATVDGNGLVNAVSAGQATILVKSVDGGITAMCNVKVNQPVTGITLSTKNITIKKGETAWISATVAPENANDKTIRWSSSDTKIATVDASGQITAIEPGICSIIGMSSSGIAEECTVEVKQAVTGIKLNSTRKTLMKGREFKLKVTLTPSDADNKAVTFSSSNPKVAKVSSDGVVTALRGGEAVIVARTNDRGLTASCSVSVQELVTKISLPTVKGYVQKGDSITLPAKVYPSTATNKRIRWKSNNEKILTVSSNGVVKVKGYGKATIYAFSTDGSKQFAKTTLEVERPLKSIKLNRSKLDIVKKDSKRLHVSLSPKNVSYKQLKWTSSNKSIAKVDKYGNVTGVAGGKAIISCTHVKTGKIASCVVNVTEQVSSLKLSGVSTRGEISLGYTKKIKTTILPKTATNKKLYWYSSNPSVLQVDQSGNVTAVACGNAIIYARTTDGSDIVESVGLTVIKPVGRVAVSPSNISLLEGRSQQATAVVSPADATYSGVKWSTSDGNVAVVDERGMVTAVSQGVCKVTATSRDGNKVKGTILVKVYPLISATSVAINSTSITMLPGQGRRLTARIKPSNTTENISWSSSDTSVVDVDQNGYVTAKGQGLATITVTTSDTGLEATCDIVVLALNATSVTLEQYDSYDLDVFGATEKITWYSNNKRVATVDANGKVVARRAGTTIITAKVNGKVLHCTVTVRKMN